MKIFYITMQFPVRSETFASSDVETLRRKGHDLSVFSMRPKNIYFNKLMRERGHSGLRVTHFSGSEAIRFLIFLLKHPSMAFSLLHWVLTCCAKSPRHMVKSLVLFPSAISIFSAVLRDKPDVVHLFWGHYPAMVGYLVKKYMANTVVSMFLGAHDLTEAFPGSVFFAEDSDLIFTHSQSNLGIMRDMGLEAENVNVVFRGTRLAHCNKMTFEKNYLSNRLVFLSAGRLIKEKGFEDVLNIFRLFVERNPSAKLYIAGDGPFRSELERMVDRFKLDKSVFLLGHIDQEDLIQMMQKAHFFLLMSKYTAERLPNVVKEAMYQKCVVITTNTQGIDELIEHGVDGFVVDKGDCVTALSYINICLQDVMIAKDIGRFSREKIAQKFNVDYSMQLYLDKWQEVKTNMWCKVS